MCLISMQLKQHASYKLMLVANRDEQYDRPSLPAHFWSDHPDLLAGKDLREHGTWLGITKQGRIAAVTNSYLTTDQESDKKLSRGNLVMDYLTGSMGPTEYLEQVRQQRTDYNGFNLIVGSSSSLHHYNNILDEISMLPVGNHAVSNATLDTPWPKVTRTKAAMAELASSSPLDEESIFRIMADRTPAPDDQLPDLPLPLPIKRAVSANFIETERYGTPLASSLRVLSAEFRNERMMRAEEKAARLPAIMTVPLILFILPVLFVVILGPAACSIGDAFSGGALSGG